MKLYYDLHDIMKRSHGHPPKIILTGYYSMGATSCLTSLTPDQIKPEEATWLETQTTKLNKTIQSVASEFPNTTYVSIDTTHHGLCAVGNNRWVQGMSDPAPFHLTAEGEQAFADAIYARLK
jgi:lysophospholipase L1-like esterase